MFQKIILLQKKRIVIRKNITWILLMAFLFIGNSTMFAQEKKPTIPKYILAHLSFSFQSPGADLSDRFGWNNSAGLGLELLNRKNYIFGVQFDFLFGTRVNEDVLANLRTSDGHIIGNNAALSTVKLTQRGFNSQVLVGKLFPFSKKDPRFGIRATVGGGMLQHRIRIQQDPQSLVPQTIGDYEAGYDRLSNGVSFTEFIGIQKVSKNKTINFIFGAEFIQGFTQSRRDFNFITREKDETKRFDFLIGGKLSWTIPFEINPNIDELYY